MVISLVSVIAGLALLFGGGELLVRGSVQLAERMGVTPLVIGLIIVGFGTSMPELVTSLEAALRGTPDIAWGNIVGSNIANSILILGAAAATMPILLGSNGLKRDAGFGLAATVLLIVIAYFGSISFLAGIALVAILFAYLAYAYVEESREPEVHGAAFDKGAAHTLTIADAPPPERAGWVKPVFFTLAGLGLLVAGGKLLVGGAVEIATIMGLSDVVIGLTIVAIGTSLPEMVTSVIAALRGEGEIAIGNIAGSNIYNILGIGGATAIASPGPLPQAMMGFDIAILLGASALLLFFIMTRKVIGRKTGALLLVAYAAYLTATILRTV